MLTFGDECGIKENKEFCMYNQVEVEKKERRKVIIVAAVTAGVILLLIVAIIVVAVNKSARKEDSGSATFSMTSDESSASAANETGESKAEEPEAKSGTAVSGKLSTEAGDKSSSENTGGTSAKKTDDKNSGGANGNNSSAGASSAIPSTGAEEVWPLALVLGMLVTAVSSRMLLQKSRKNACIFRQQHI